MIVVGAGLQEQAVAKGGHAIDGLARHRVTTDKGVDAAPAKRDDQDAVGVRRDRRKEQV